MKNKFIRILKIVIWILGLFFCLNTLGQNNNEFYKKALKDASINNFEAALSNLETAIKLEGNKVPELFYFHKYELNILFSK